MPENEDAAFRQVYYPEWLRKSKATKSAANEIMAFRDYSRMVNQGTTEPSSVAPPPDLGTETGIRARHGILEKAQGLYQEYVSDALQDAIGNTVALGNILGLNDPASAYGDGAANASISMLSKSPIIKKLPPAVEKATEYIMKRWPRLSRIGKYSKFVETLKNKKGQVTEGKYNPFTDTATIATMDKIPSRSLINPVEKVPSSAEQIIRRMVHEDLVHAVQYKRGLKDGEMPPELLEVYMKGHPGEKFLRKVAADNGEFLENDTKKIEDLVIKRIKEAGILAK